MEIKNNKIISILLVIIPFIYLFPLASGLVAMGNDFDLIYYSYKKYFFQFLEEGFIPLWSPGEATGYSFIFNPFAQVFYLPGYINFILLLFKGTFSLQDYLLFTILGISIFNIGLFKWLLFFNNNKLTSLIAVLVTSSCLLITGFVKFPNAVHSFAWFPYILLGINYSFYEEYKLRSFCLIFFPFLFLLTAGYPYFVVYFSLFLLLYFFFIFNYQIKYNLKKNIYNKKFLFNLFLRNILSFASPVILLFPWIKGVKSTLDLTSNRMIEDLDVKFNFATEHTFNIVDIIGSWIFPIASNTAGRYNFGIFVTIIIIFYLISYIFNKQKTKKKNYLISSCIIFFIIITSLASTKDSYFFIYIWEKIDFIQNLRTWPRINILLIPIIALILSFSLEHMIDNKNLGQSILGKFNNKIVILSISIIILFSQIYLLINKFQSSYWDIWQKKRFEYAGDTLGKPFKFILDLFEGEIHIFFTLLVILFILSFFNSNSLFNNKKKIFVIFFIIVTYSELFLISNLQWSLDKWKTDSTHLKINIKDEFQNRLKNNREFKSLYGNTFFRDKRFQINNFADWGYENHVVLIRKYYPLYPVDQNYYETVSSKQIENFNKFFGVKNNEKIFLSSSLNHTSIDSFLDDVNNYTSIHDFTLKIDWKNYFGNELQINLHSSIDGWLTFVDNWDPYWKAYINDKEVKINKLFNTYKSIKFESGFNSIKFIYKPFKF